MTSTGIMFHALISLLLATLFLAETSCRESRPRDHRKKSPFSRKERIPSYQIAWVSYEAKLNCPLEGRNPLGITWSKNGLDINEGEDSRIEFSSDGLQLTIFDSTEEDTGEYACLAAFGDGPEIHKITLTVADPEKVQGKLLTVWMKTGKLESMKNLNLLGNAPYFISRRPEKADKTIWNMPAGEDLKLPCEVFGKPEPEIYWYKNGKPITRVPEFQSNRRRNYVLNNLQKEDSGNYTCLAANYFGNISRTHTVEVDTCIREKPTILSITPLDPRVPPNDGVNLECIVENCRFPPVIRWLKQEAGAKSAMALGELTDLIPVHGCQLASRHKEANQYRCTYRIANFTAEDAGVYVCHAMNHIRGEDLSRLTLLLDTSLEEERQHETMTFLYYTLGGIVVLIAICIAAACCCVYCGKTKPEKETYSPPKSSSSTFKRQIAPDYIVTGRHPCRDVGPYGVNLCGSPSSPPSGKGRISVPTLQALRDPLLENSSPDHSMRKFDGVATEYEEVAEDLSVYDYYPPHPPSFVSGYTHSDPAYSYR